MTTHDPALVEAVARVLCLWDDCGYWLDDPGPHCGDCTNQSHTCRRCLQAQFTRKAETILDLIPRPPLPAAQYIPRCGDLVHHRPSGEDWIVAFADAGLDELAWTGWPDGRAKLSDCDVVKRCSDGEHTEAVRRWLTVTGSDSRAGTVRRLYGPEC